MQYKTILHELLQQRPKLYEMLRQSGDLLSVLNRCAADLRTSHQAWIETLSLSRPGTNSDQIPSIAFEHALAELEDRLHSAFPQKPEQTLSLDAAITFIRNPTRSD